MNVLYAGGCDQLGQPIKTAEVYDFASKTWSSLPDMPVPRAASTGAVVRDNQIIVVGGVTSKQVPLKRVDCFDVGSNEWVKFPSLPVGVTGPYVRLVGDKLYCIGGTDKKDCNQSVVFDFKERDLRWQSLPPKPSPCYSCGGYLYEGKLIIVGGRKGKDPVQAVEALDLETQQWEKLASMNVIRVFYSVVGIEDEIYVLGGLVPMVGISKIVERYSIEEDMWCRVKDLSVMRSDCAYGVVGSRVVVTGGLGGAPEKPCAMDTGECIEHRGRRFKKVPQLSKPRSSVTTIMFEGKMAVANGVGDGGLQAIVEILKLKDSKDKHV